MAEEGVGNRVEMVEAFEHGSSQVAASSQKFDRL